MASDTLGRSASGSATQDSVGSSKTDGNRSRPGRTGTARTVCAFWIGERCFGLDTGLVGEVVSVEQRVSVPLAPPAIDGVFNLRGEPLPLISLAKILGVGRATPGSQVVTAMVLRAGDVAAGLSIDRVEAILPLGSKGLIPPTSVAEDSIVQGFLETTTEGTTTVVSVLDPTALLDRVMQLRFSREPSA